MIARKLTARALRTLDRGIATGLGKIIEAVEGEDVPRFEVAITKRDNNGKGIEGKVGSAVATSYVVAQRVGYVEWEPLYAEKKDSGERVELPDCFKLSGDATIALEEARGQ